MGDCLKARLLLPCGVYRRKCLALWSISNMFMALRRLLEEVSTFAQAQLSNTLVDSPYVRDQRAIKIEGYHRQIQTLIICFQVRMHILLN